MLYPQRRLYLKGLSPCDQARATGATEHFETGEVEPALHVEHGVGYSGRRLRVPLLSRGDEFVRHLTNMPWFGLDSLAEWGAAPRPRPATFL